MPILHQLCYQDFLASKPDTLVASVFCSWWRHQMEHFPRYWPFVRGIHRSPVNSPHKGQWRGALMFSLICVWINDWVNNREAGDMRRHRAHCDVIVMFCILVTMPLYVTLCLLCHLLTSQVLVIYIFIYDIWLLLVLCSGHECHNLCIEEYHKYQLYVGDHIYGLLISYLLVNWTFYHGHSFASRLQSQLKVIYRVHDDVTKWERFPCYRPFVRGIHRWPVNSPHKGQWRGSFMFSMICVWTNGWVNNRGACVLRRYSTHHVL